MNSYCLLHLSNGALLSHDQSVNARGRAATADELASLGEIDIRKLYLPAGRPSMHSWCVHVRHMSEDSASRRIQAARLACRCPAILPMVADGRLHLAAVLLLDPHLEPGNSGELLALATHQSKRELERLLAERFPKPDLPAWVMPLAPVLAADPESVSAPVRIPLSGFVSPSSSPARVAPRSGTTYGIQYTFDQADFDLLEYAQALLGHQVPTGDVAEVSRRALRALVAQLEKQRFGAGRMRRHGQRRGSDSRHVPAAVKAAVWKRDGGRCTFVGDHGQRCPARTLLQFDHIHPVGRGGGSEAANLRLLCAAHNQYEADRAYGAAFMNGKREARAQAQAGTRAPTPVPAQTVSQSREQAHAFVAEQEQVPAVDAPSDPEVVEDAVAALRSLGYRERDARETLERCGLPPGATLEQHVRAALALRATPLLVRSARMAQMAS